MKTAVYIVTNIIENGKYVTKKNQTGENVTIFKNKPAALVTRSKQEAVNTLMYVHIYIILNIVGLRILTSFRDQ